MSTHGVIYEYRKHGRRPRHMRRLFRLITLFGIFGFVLMISPMLVTEAQYRVGLSNDDSLNQVEIGKQVQEINQNIETGVSPLSTGGFGKLINNKVKSTLSPANDSFSLIIPKIGINSTVIPNVDISDKNAYNSALKKGIAHASGSAFPGAGGNVYLFAHSTDFVWNILSYNALFYLLKDVQTGDVVYVVYNGSVFPYRVREQKIVNPEDVDFLRPDYSGDQLTLQTCYPPGTTWKRLLVFADPAPIL